MSVKKLETYQVGQFSTASVYLSVVSNQCLMRKYPEYLLFPGAKAYLHVPARGGQTSPKKSPPIHNRIMNCRDMEKLE